MASVGESTPAALTDRERLTSAIVDALTDLDHVRAIWEAGSASFGRLDDLSDIDLSVVVRDDAIEPTFAAIETALTEIAPLELTWRVPEPTWHGHAQCFYRLEGLPPELMLDICVMRSDAPSFFLEPEQHGTPIVLLDRDGLAHAPDFDAAAHRERMRSELEQLRARVPMLANLVSKELRRGRVLDAITFNERIVLAPLVTLLGMRHRPLRYDFGMRYLHGDLPAGDAERLARLAYVASPGELAAKHGEALAWFTELAAAIDVDAIPLDELSAAVRASVRAR